MKVLKTADFQNLHSFCFRYEWSHLGNHYVKSILIISYLDVSISLCPTFPPYLAFMTFHQIAYLKKVN